jgi:hypothetical protein
MVARGCVHQPYHTAVSRAASRRLPGSRQKRARRPLPRSEPGQYADDLRPTEQGGTIGQAVHGERDGGHTHLLCYLQHVWLASCETHGLHSRMTRHLPNRC